jgi:hypothetical protein
LDDGFVGCALSVLVLGRQKQLRNQLEGEKREKSWWLVAVVAVSRGWWLLVADQYPI